ncbi:hypothetical protein [Lysobacter sp. HA18]
MGSDAEMPNASTSSRRRQYVVIAGIAVLALLAGGYQVGRDMAHRDNARAEAAR